MPTEPTPPSDRRARPGAGGRRRALGLVTVDGPPPSQGRISPTGTRGAPTGVGAVGNTPDAPDTAPPAAPAMWRRAGFALVLAVLVVAIPALGLVGYRTLSNSTDGRFAKTSSNPGAPGYVAQVEPTPTAVVIQYDKAHLPVGATFLSLSSPVGGGAVIFVPLDIGVLVPKLGAGPLRAAYLAFADQPEVARDQLAAKVGDVLNVGVGEVAELDDAQWAQLVAPVAPLRFDNPEEVVLADGTVIAAGLTELTADHVGPYLAVTKGAETETARLVRSQVVWKAWLDQVAKAGPGAVPGETTTGIGHFAQRLAAGTVSYDSVPVVTSRGPLLNVSKNATADLVTDAVPSPTPSHPGSRFTIRLLDGVSAGSIPPDLTRDLVRFGASVTVIGNAPSFGQTATGVVYGDRANASTAKSVLRRIGGKGTARFDPEAPDTVDLTIVLGTDILGAAPAASTSPATTNTTQGP